MSQSGRMASSELTDRYPVTPVTSVDLTSSSTNNSDGIRPQAETQIPPSPTNEEETFLEDAVHRPPYLRGESFPNLSSKPSIPTTTQLPFRLRTQSPSRSQIRPHSSSGVVTMPLMQRAHSSPGVDSSGRFVYPNHTVPRRPSSPLHSGRRKSPLRTPMDDFYPGTSSWSGLSMEPNIPEHEELEITHENDLMYPSPVPSYSNTFPRSRRRPTSPLHQSISAPSLHTRSVSPHTSVPGSLSFTAQKYANEPYPTYSFSSASSMPSTPTSLRSRSPSISSLETIEDTPDAEEAALMEQEESKSKVEDIDHTTDLRRRSSLELRGSNLKSNKERKRWSVCGAERRADFSLEPIEE